MKKLKLIFIPGWGTDSSIFKVISEELKAHSIYIEWWNCLSDNKDNNALYMELKLSDDPVLIVGWSLGGLIALSVAIKYQKKIKISGLFLISTTPKMVEDEGYCGVNKNVIKAMIHKLNRNSIETLLKDFFSLCVDKTDNSISNLLSIAIKIEKEHLLSGLLYLQNTDIRNELDKIELPVKLIHGGKDRVISIKNGIYLSEKLSRSEIKILQEEEHLFFIKDPFFLVDEISNFINKI
jgi:pimeloyl-[acyl-carrier protein] methyl ester esterase